MKSIMMTATATLALFGAAFGQQTPKVQLYTGSGCSGGENEISVEEGVCDSADGQSAQQDKAQNGIKFTCDGFSDSACKNKVGEVYDCLNSPISYVQCFANPPF